MLSFNVDKREITLRGLKTITFKVDEYVNIRGEEKTSGDGNYSQKIILTIKRNGKEKEITIKYPKFHVENQEKESALLFVTGCVASIINGSNWTCREDLFEKIEVIGDYASYCKQRWKEELERRQL